MTAVEEKRGDGRRGDGNRRGTPCGEDHSDFFSPFLSSRARSERSKRGPVGRRSINHERTTGPIVAFDSGKVRPCALISNGFTEGPAADDATAAPVSIAGSPTPSPYFRREYITGVAVFCRDVSLRNTRHHRFLLFPPPRLPLSSLPEPALSFSPSSGPSSTDNR